MRARSSVLPSAALFCFSIVAFAKPAFSANYYQTCINNFHSPSAKTSTEYTITSYGNTAIQTIDVYNDNGTNLKSYTSGFPGSIRTTQTQYQTQSFTTNDIFPTQETGRLLARVGFIVPASVGVPVMEYTITFLRPDGTVAAKIRDRCL